MVRNLKFYRISFVFIMAALASACSMHKDDGTTPESTDGVTQQSDTALTETPQSGVEMLPTTNTNDPAPPPAAKEPVAAAPAPAPVPVAKAPKVQKKEPAPMPMSGDTANYKVQKGDTLMSIAFNVYGDIMKWKDIYDLNKDALKDPNALSAGMSLNYMKPSSEPSIEKMGDPYRIKKGDTLGTIAYDIYGKKSKWKSIWENNKTLIKDPNKIYAGFYVYYQITEEEKKEAEQLKSKAPAQLGDASPAPSTPVAAAKPAAAKPVPVAAAKPAAPADTGGLAGLIQSGTNNRAPASSK